MVVKVGEAVKGDLSLMQQGIHGTVRKGLGKAECVEVLDPGGSSIKPSQDRLSTQICFVLQLFLESDFDGRGFWSGHFSASSMN